jgi:hypothetical protein
MSQLFAVEKVPQFKMASFLNCDYVTTSTSPLPSRTLAMAPADTEQSSLYKAAAEAFVLYYSRCEAQKTLVNDRPKEIEFGEASQYYRQVHKHVSESRADKLLVEAVDEAELERRELTDEENNLGAVFEPYDPVLDRITFAEKCNLDLSGMKEAVGMLSQVLEGEW